MENLCCYPQRCYERRKQRFFISLTEDVTAQGVIRQGDVGDEITNLCRDLGADYLILGRPQDQEEETVFSEALFAQFIERIEKQTGAKVVPLDGDGK